MRALPETVELTINLLINAIAAALKGQYGYRVYARELRQGFKDPCFFIEVLPGHSRRIGARRLERLQALVIHFYPKGFDRMETTDEVVYPDDLPPDEPAEPVWDFECEALAVGEELYRLLEWVEVSNKVFNGNTIKCRGTNMGYSISSGVLHFNVNYNYHLLEEMIYPYMEALVQNISPKSLLDFEN